MLLITNEADKMPKKLSEIRTTIYLTGQQHEILLTIANENKLKNKKKIGGGKKKPDSIAHLIRAAINRCYIHPYIDYHVEEKRYKKKGTKKEK